MIAHPPLNSRSTNKLNNIRRKNYTKKKSSQNESKKKISEIEKLEMENKEMEQRLQELKLNLAKEKEKRLKQGKTSFWQSGKKGVLFNHGNEVIYNKNLSQMKNKNNMFGTSLKSSSSGVLKNNEMFDSMRYHNNNNKNTFNILTTSSTIHRTEPNIKLINTKKNNKNIKIIGNKKNLTEEDSESKIDTGTTVEKKKDKFIQNKDLNYKIENYESEKDMNNNIVFKKTNKDMINFSKYLDSTKNHINSISISSNEDKQIIKSKYDKIVKSHNDITEKGSTNNSLYNNELYYNNYISDNSKNENQNNERLIDGEFNEEESHNSFMEALNMWRKERNDQKSNNLNNNKKNKFKVTFNDDYNIKNASETQTKELTHSLNIDEIVKNIQNSKSNLSYMDRLALYKYREQYKKNMETSNKITASDKDYEITEIDEDEIDAEVEKYWESNLNNESNDDKEIENNINSYVNQYKMNQIALRNNGNSYNNNNENIFNTKTSVYIDDSDDENEINDYNEISPIVAEPEEA